MKFSKKTLLEILSKKLWYLNNWIILPQAKRQPPGSGLLNSYSSNLDGILEIMSKQAHFWLSWKLKTYIIMKFVTGIFLKKYL